MRILVAMSGGIDSAVAALLLQRQGHEVVGMTLRVHDDPERGARSKSCCAPKDMIDARDVALSLGIPYYAVDMRQEFREQVILPFAQSYLAGRTPSPCVTCNSDFKFGLLFQRAKALGFECVATGHYARTQLNEVTGKVELLRGVDRHKDQSYFLFALTQAQLAQAIFPLGALCKSEVRQIAAQAGLPIADKPESQEICFVPHGHYAAVVEELHPEARQKSNSTAPEIRDASGNVLGAHGGIHHFTVGQRRGLGVSAPRPLYVTGLDAKKNQVRVGPEEDLYRQELYVERINWLEPVGVNDSLSAHVAIRYRHEAAPAVLQAESTSRAKVSFDEKQRAIAPGQAAVFYRGERVLGGGWIV